MPAGNERFQQKKHVLLRNWPCWITSMEGKGSDGEIAFGRVYDAQGSTTASEETLTEIHNGAEVVVDSFETGIGATTSFGIREIMNEVLQSVFGADARPPELTTYERLVCTRQIGTLLNDLDPHIFDAPFGIPQAHNSITLPPVTSVTGADSGAGTVPDGTYYVHVVPVTINNDEFTGLANPFTLANFAAGLFNSGVDYARHTVASSSSFSVAGGSSGVLASWTADATGGPRPTHYLILVGTNSSPINSANKVSAIVAYGTNSVTITALGTAVMAALPTLTDLRFAATIAAQETDLIAAGSVSWDAETGEMAWADQTTADLKSGAPVELTFWRIQTATDVYKRGAAGVDQVFVSIRMRNMRSTNPDPTLSRARGLTVDWPKVGVVRVPTDVLSANPSGFHNPVQVRLTPIFDTSKGYLVKITGEGPEKQNLVDYFSREYGRRNVLVA